jgi:large subunit ribosomal protein L4
MDLKLINDSGKPAATVAASDSLFGREYNEALIHQLVTAYQANARSGNRAQKGRADINKSHKKRARPIARCGAVAERFSPARPMRTFPRK